MGTTKRPGKIACRDHSVSLANRPALSCPSRLDAISRHPIHDVDRTPCVPLRKRSPCVFKGPETSKIQGLQRSGRGRPAGRRRCGINPQCARRFRYAGTPLFAGESHGTAFALKGISDAGCGGRATKRPRRIAECNAGRRNRRKLHPGRETRHRQPQTFTPMDGAFRPSIRNRSPGQSGSQPSGDPP